jgi:multidrug efflux pump
VLAIGIVVDDAIVVVENVERIMHEEHLPVREATIKAMDEVTGPVIAIVLVLSAVFLPVAFLGGLTGELYRSSPSRSPSRWRSRVWWHSRSARRCAACS